MHGEVAFSPDGVAVPFDLVLLASFLVPFGASIILMTLGWRHKMKRNVFIRETSLEESCWCRSHINRWVLLSLRAFYIAFD